MNFPIHPRGFWETNEASGHHYDQALSEALLEYLQKIKVKSLYDFGCGMGDYARDFIQAGIKTKAFDGNPNTPTLSKGLASTLDLSTPFNLPERFNAVLSLEVGEHIPATYESIYLSNITRHTKKYLIISWAVPGQIGDGHVNCQSNEYIIQKLQSTGFTYIKKDSDFLRERSTADWFINTIMVFKKKNWFQQLGTFLLRTSYQESIINTKRTC